MRSLTRRLFSSSLLFAAGLSSLLFAHVSFGGPLLADRPVEVDATPFNLADELSIDISRNVQDALSDHINMIAFSSENNPRPWKGWMQALGSLRKRGEVDEEYGFKYTLGGMLVGADRSLSDNARIGIFGGATSGKLAIDDTSQKTDVKSLLGGFYANYIHNGGYFFTGTFTMGRTLHESQRPFDVGLFDDIAKASYRGIFVSPTLTFGYNGKLGPVSFVPTLHLGYAFSRLDGYKESGANDFLFNTAINTYDVNKRVFHSFEYRLKLAIPFERRSEAGRLLRMEGYLGLEGRNNLREDASEMKIRVSGSNRTYKADSGDARAFLMGLGLYYAIGESSSFMMSLDGTRLIGDKTRVARGRAGFKFDF